MSENRSTEELSNLLNEINDNFSNQAKNLKQKFSNDNLTRTQIEKFIESIGSLEKDVKLDLLELNKTGAEEFVKILKEHPVYQGAKGSTIGLPVFGNYDHTNRSVTGIRYDAANLFANGVIALGSLGISDNRNLLTLIHIAFSADSLSRSLGLLLSGKRITPNIDPPNPTIPIDLEKELKHFCGFGLLTTASEFGIALGAEIASANELAKHPFQYEASAVGIESIEPNHGCEGQVVKIIGSGFGKPSKNLKIYFPKFGGGCMPIAESDLKSWSDNLIEVTAPTNVGVGYIGFVKKIGNWEPPKTNLGEAADSLAGTMEMCIGLAGFGGAEHVRKVGRYHSPAPGIPCPGALPNNENYFCGGPPYIKSFTINGENEKIDIIKGNRLKIEWNIQNASKLTIEPIAIGAQQNELEPILNPGSIGSSEVKPDGKFAWAANFEIQAQNECATVRKHIQVMLRLPVDTFPTSNDFLWGVATSALQVEGNITANDWDLFSKSPKITKRVQDNAARAKSGYFQMAPPGLAIGHSDLHIFNQDLSRAKALGLNTYRFSIEWSRIQPNPPQWATNSITARKNGKLFEALFWESLPIQPADMNFDTTAIRFYRDMVQAIIQKGLIPVVTLNHLSLPKWVLTPPVDDVHVGGGYHGGWDGDLGLKSSLGGWHDARIHKAFLAFVDRVVPEFPEVKYWITLNEPVGSIMGAGYIAGVWSPGFVADQGKAKDVMQNLIKAHVAAFDKIKALRPDAQVGIAHAMIFFKVDQNENGGIWGGKNDAARNQLNYMCNEYFLNAIVKGDIDDEYHRNPSKRKIRRVDDISATNWKPKLDFIGVNYYRSAYVFRDDLFAIATGLVWGGGYHNDMRQWSEPHNLINNLINELGWEIYPEGLYTILKQLHDDYLQLPILITENGMPEFKDTNRPAYTISHLNQLKRAKDEGVNILGYIHWSLVDNWEWQTAYMHNARFGIFRIPTLDGSDPTLPREITETAIALQYAIAETGPSFDGNIQPVIDKFGVITDAGDTTKPPTESAGSVWEGALNISPTTNLPITVYISTLKNKELVGMIFYHGMHLWVRLSNIYWDDAAKILHFSHIIDNYTTKERRMFEARPVNNTIIGTMIDEDLNTGMLYVYSWSASKNNLHGLWKAAPNQGLDLIAVLINMFEGKPQGKILFGTPREAWESLESLSVNSNGQLNSAYSIGFSITGQVSGNNMNLNLKYGNDPVNPSWNGIKVSDGLPF